MKILKYFEFTDYSVSLLHVQVASVVGVVEVVEVAAAVVEISGIARWVENMVVEAAVDMVRKLPVMLILVP